MGIDACDAVTAASLDGFRQVAPLSGAAPTRGTLLRIAEDGTSLLIDIHAQDPEPANIVARQRRRDHEALLGEDHVAVVIDVGAEGRDALFFAVNPIGAQFDGLVYDGGSLRSDWDTLWQSSASIDADGWSASLKIPLSALGQQGAQLWRINAERWVPHVSERLRLAGWRADQRIEALGPGVEIRRTARQCTAGGTRLKTSLRAEHASGEQFAGMQRDWRLAPGLELFHEGRGGWRAAAAFNIDFGEAEVDERQVYLDRFELFRDEKRAFFLEDAGRFSFGGLDGDPVLPFYSRRIGLDETGQAQDLQFAGKLGGEIAGFEAGLLAARLESPPTQTAGSRTGGHQEVAVARITRSAGERHLFGAIGTAGNPAGTGSNLLWGVDHHFRDTAWRGERTLETRTWLMGSRSQGEAALAFGASFDYPNLGPTAYASITRIGPGFHPALGYLAEDDVLLASGTLGWWRRTAHGSDSIPGMDWSWRRRLDGSEYTRELNPEWVFVNAAGDSLVVEGHHIEDRLAVGYDPLPAVHVEPGRHVSRRWSMELASASSRSLSGGVGGNGGGFHGGRSHQQFAWLGWQPSAGWALNLSAEHLAIRLDSGADELWTGTLGLDLTPDTRLAIGTLLQWDSLSREFGMSSRVQWRHRERWEVYFSLNMLGYPRDAPWRQPAGTSGTLKVVLNLGG